LTRIDEDRICFHYGDRAEVGLNGGEYLPLAGGMQGAKTSHILVTLPFQDYKDSIEATLKQVSARAMIGDSFEA
jgi:hypothetical protein